MHSNEPAVWRCVVVALSRGGVGLKTEHVFCVKVSIQASWLVTLLYTTHPSSREIPHSRQHQKNLREEADLFSGRTSVYQGEELLFIVYNDKQ